MGGWTAGGRSEEGGSCWVKVRVGSVHSPALGQWAFVTPGAGTLAAASEAGREWGQGTPGAARSSGSRAWGPQVAFGARLASDFCLHSASQGELSISQGDHIPATLREMVSEGHRDRARRGSEGGKGMPSPSGLWAAVPTAWLKGICGFVVPGCPQLIWGGQWP